MRCRVLKSFCKDKIGCQHDPVLSLKPVMARFFDVPKRALDDFRIFGLACFQAIQVKKIR